MYRPLDLYVFNHHWNDSFNSHTVIAAVFEKVQDKVLDGWAQDELYCLGGARYFKHFPYGAIVVQRGGQKCIVI